MAEWIVQYQRTPTNYSPTECLVVEAPTEVDAWVTVYDHLVRMGRTVLTSSAFAYGEEFLAEIEGRVTRSYGNTLIYHPKPYKVQFTGKIVKE